MRRALTIAVCLSLVGCQSILGFEEFHGATGDDRGGDGGVDAGLGSVVGSDAAGATAGRSGGSGSIAGGSGSGAGGSHADGGSGAGGSGSGSGTGGGSGAQGAGDAGPDATVPGCSGADCTEDCNGVEGGGGVPDACGACDDDPDDDCPVVVTEGLVAEWRFDRASGSSVPTSARSSCGDACTASLLNFADTSGRDVDASSGWVAEPDVVGGAALRLDGANDYVEIPDSDQLLHGWNAFTVELLVRVDDLSGDRALWSSQDPGGAGNAFGSYVDSDGTVSGNAYASKTSGCDADVGPCREVQSTTPIAAGAFRHIAFVLSTGELSLFVDAVDETAPWSSVGALTMIANPTVAHRIGAYFVSGSPSMRFDGEIAVVRVYDRALSSTELADNLAAELP